MTEFVYCSMYILDFEISLFGSDPGCIFVDNICRESIRFLWNQVVRSWKKGEDFDVNNFCHP